MLSHLNISNFNIVRTISFIHFNFDFLPPFVLWRLAMWWPLIGRRGWPDTTWDDTSSFATSSALSLPLVHHIIATGLPPMRQLCATWTALIHFRYFAGFKLRASSICEIARAVDLHRTCSLVNPTFLCKILPVCLGKHACMGSTWSPSSQLLCHLGKHARALARLGRP